jgi:hypothetical protein
VSLFTVRKVLACCFLRLEWSMWSLLVILGFPIERYLEVMNGLSPDPTAVAGQETFDFPSEEIRKN